MLERSLKKLRHEISELFIPIFLIRNQRKEE